MEVVSHSILPEESVWLVNLQKGHAPCSGMGKGYTKPKCCSTKGSWLSFDGPYRKYPLVIVYHPSNPKDGNKWVNIGCGMA